MMAPHELEAALAEHRNGGEGECKPTVISKCAALTAAASAEVPALQGLRARGAVFASRRRQVGTTWVLACCPAFHQAVCRVLAGIVLEQPRATYCLSPPTARSDPHCTGVPGTACPIVQGEVHQGVHGDQEQGALACGVVCFVDPVHSASHSVASPAAYESTRGRLASPSAMFRVSRR